MVFRLNIFKNDENENSEVMYQQDSDSEDYLQGYADAYLNFCDNNYDYVITEISKPKEIKTKLDLFRERLPPKKDCYQCHGTGKVRQICFGNPGTIYIDCSCTFNPNYHPIVRYC